jgi:glycosyltransferase involved in cell wall biosynthesis
LRGKLEDLIEKEAIKDNVIFTGLREDMAELLQIFDKFYWASEYEGMGRAILEAQAAGRPVVATGIGGIVGIVDENKTVILVSPRDVDALASGIVEVIKDENL